MKHLLRGVILAATLLAPALANAQAGITPCSAKTISVNNGSSSNVQLSTCGETVLLWNTGTQELFYNFGSGSGTAATTSNWSLPGGSFVVLNIPTTGNPAAGMYMAAITGSSTTTLRITQGQTR